jgi:hypothetical protein
MCMQVTEQKLFKETYIVIFLETSVRRIRWLSEILSSDLSIPSAYVVWQADATTLFIVACRQSWNFETIYGG